MKFEEAGQIADAVLFEGYVLYPYRASAPKNRFRWTFGVLGPRAWAEAGGCEPSWMQTDCLIEHAPTCRVDVRLRFLQNRRRSVERLGGKGYEPVEVLEIDDQLHLPWDEGVSRELDFEALPCGTPTSIVRRFEIPAAQEVERIVSRAGQGAGRLVRRCHRLEGIVQFDVQPLEAQGRTLSRLRIRVENTTTWNEPEAKREDVLPACLIGTHLLLHAEGGAFWSMFDPPSWAAEEAAACQFERCYPVLVGPSGERRQVLAAPIILYDYPSVAPESPGDLFDAAEIDELLTLRTRTLTDEEKRQARATDPKAARIIDQVDAMPPQVYERLHGALRDLKGGEMVPRGTFPPDQRSSHGHVRGARVVLRPGKRRTDAQDLLFAGCRATIQAVLRDVDDQEVLAVTIDDDPAAELHQWYGRFHYYYPDEVEPAESEVAK